MTNQELIQALLNVAKANRFSPDDQTKSLFAVAELRLREMATEPNVAEPEKVGKRVGKSRTKRWADAASEALAGIEALKEVREEYQEWLDNLPENLQSSNLAEKLQTVCDLDLDSASDVIEEADGADLPLGFGRD